MIVAILPVAHGETTVPVRRPAAGEPAVASRPAETSRRVQRARKARQTTERTGETHVHGRPPARGYGTQPGARTNFPSLNNDNLAHSDAEKKKAAKCIEEHLGPGTKKAGVIADDASELVAGNPSAPTAVSSGTMRDWEVQKALSHRMGEWRRHFRQLDGRLDSELAGLRGNNLLFGRTEVDTRASFNGITPLYRSAILDHVPGAGAGPGTGTPVPKPSPLKDF